MTGRADRKTSPYTSRANWEAPLTPDPQSQRESQMTKNITFFSGSCEIEGCLNPGTLDQGVVITHPHPLYGGDMHNTVVLSIMAAYRKQGYTTLRFNFRGVGNSQGFYDKGIGEQEDVRAALAYLNKMGINKTDLAGYSFGAWVNALLACQDHRIDNMVMVSPLVGFIDFQSIAALDCLKLIVSGSRDEFAPAELINKFHSLWNPRAHFEVIDGADHFFAGHLTQLEAILSRYLGVRGQSST
ncbi:MAG: dienelactone hydrolase family protein [Desulfobacterales bacterium]|nr:MAG: dienelactone hydrolase family protein [Desulfobacterales bacterium]